ncbi:tape measure protein [Hydrogenoanaerobacterium sp.]|uniref:tape measure protein n=1 Tax=Hydrogenoanaerobacterium sp. TaxID=2953763 RepID=UPI00289E8414|nr:tape measure protein [Hydrogenoanaerobacterium sp.]
MGRDIGIMISAKETFSDACKTMQAANRSFNKDLDGLQLKLDKLNQNKTTLKVESDAAKKALKEAQKQFEATGDAADRMALELANADYDNVKRNLDLVAKNARQAEKDMLNLTSAVSKAENRASGGIRGGSTESDLLGSLAAAGMTKMIGDSLSGALSVGITSAFGGEAGSAINTMLSGTISGAAMGAMAGGLPGAAVGAVAGVISGGITAATQHFAKQDDAFKGVVQEQYGIQQERMATDLTTGSGFAAEREMDQIAFSKLMGDENTAKDFLSGIKDMANTTPFLYNDLKQMSKVMSTYGYSPDEIPKLLTKVGDTGAALGMDTQSMAMVSTYIGRMNSTGKTTMEYLNPLMERGIPALDYLSDALGKSKAKITEMVSRGLIPGADAARIIADSMGEANEGAMSLQSQTYAGLKSTVEGLQQEMQNAMGEGYNERRKTGLADQVEYLSGESGQKMQEANRLIGEWKAELENQYEWQIRNAEREAFRQIEEKGLQGAEAGRVLMEARTKAESDYRNSKAYKELEEADKNLIEGIGKTLKESWNHFGWELGQEFTRGIVSYINSEESAKAIQDVAKNQYGFDAAKHNQASASSPPSGKAFGMGYVPYNGFPSLLHEGERVLTASENRAYSAKSTPSVTIQMGGNYMVREEADIEAIAREIATQVIRAQELL